MIDDLCEIHGKSLMYVNSFEQERDFDDFGVRHGV